MATLFRGWLTLPSGSVAGEPQLPWKPGTFLKTYDKNREESALSCFESDNVSIVLKDFLETVKKWDGPAATLKKSLEEHVRNKMQDLALIADNAWPRRPNVLSGRISRIAPSLRKIGISVAKVCTRQEDMEAQALECRSPELYQLVE